MFKLQFARASQSSDSFAAFANQAARPALTRTGRFPDAEAARL